MYRRAAIAEWGFLLSLLSAQAGCSWIGVRRELAHGATTPEQSARTQQISEQAQAAVDRGDYEQARLALQQLVAQAPESAETQQRLGTVLRYEGRLSEAEACFRAALKRDRDYPEALIGLGQVEAQRSDVASALKRFETAIELDPHHPSAHLALGRLLEDIGRTDQALAEYFRVLEFEPNDAEVSLRIANIQLARNQPDQALARLDQVVELAADNAEARNLRGRAHLILRYFPQAIEDFRSAATGLPNRADIHYHLALALEADHKPADAFRAAEQAVRLAPDFADARGLTQRLALAVQPAGKTRLRPGPRPGAGQQAEPPAPPAN
jgi:tetratricopeptide (TPR) repeat protein